MCILKKTPAACYSNTMPIWGIERKVFNIQYLHLFRHGLSSGIVIGDALEIRRNKDMWLFLFLFSCGRASLDLLGH